MGMFSWCCKGCGHELKIGEYVRLNGCTGVYDGYGNAGSFNYRENDPSGWHVRCYNNATVEQKLNDDPSKCASNQGFGFEALENLKNYDPDANTTFQAVIYVHHYGKDDEYSKQQWYAVDGFLVDEHYYEKLYEAANGEDGITKDMWKSFHYKKSSIEESEAFYRLIQETVDAHIGMKRPSTNAQWYEDFEETKRFIESLIPSLPNPDFGYELVIFGKQEKTEGLYYKFNKIPGFDTIDIPGEFYPHGKPKLGFVFNGRFEEEIVFVHGRSAGENVSSY